MFRYDGQSGGETPGPFPNPEVKSARVSVCTVLRKRTGTQTRCQPLFTPSGQRKLSGSSLYSFFP